LPPWDADHNFFGSLSTVRRRTPKFHSTELSLLSKATIKAAAQLQSELRQVLSRP
jgi:hypothetical protein